MAFKTGTEIFRIVFNPTLEINMDNPANKNTQCGKLICGNSPLKYFPQQLKRLTQVLKQAMRNTSASTMVQAFPKSV